MVQISGSNNDTGIGAGSLPAEQTFQIKRNAAQSAQITDCSYPVASRTQSIWNHPPRPTHRGPPLFAVCRCPTRAKREGTAGMACPAPAPAHPTEQHFQRPTCGQCPGCVAVRRGSRTRSSPRSRTTPSIRQNCSRESITSHLRHTPQCILQGFGVSHTPCFGYNCALPLIPG